MKAETAEQLQINGDLKFSTIDERITDELVFGFVSPIGSGTSATARYLEQVLSDIYNYRVKTFKVSDIIIECKDSITAHSGKPLPKPRNKRIEILQDIGNALRYRYSSSYLAKKCVERIVHDREKTGGFSGQVGQRIAQPRRVAYIIDSLKHPDEIALLREVYGNQFLLIGVFAHDESRKDWLHAKGIPKKEIDDMMTRDQDEDFDHGQKVGKAFHLSDYFLRNDGTFNDLTQKIEILAKIIFGIGITTPTLDESAMLNAFTSASKSACLSRQVGAAIYSDTGELIGVGWNDVPKPTGGLYGSNPAESDNRCFGWTGGLAQEIGVCHNDYHKKRIFQSVVSALRKSNVLKKDVKNEDVERIVSLTEIKGIIEFSRSVHAEMEAIVSIARSAKNGLPGGTMYTTTYPCHQCARHIVAAGITRVVFIEPYPKSLANILHDDAICSRRMNNDQRVVFTQYEGIAPRIHLMYYQTMQKRKLEGKIITLDRKQAHPLAPTPLDGFSTFEGIVMGMLDKEEKNAEKGRD